MHGIIHKSFKDYVVENGSETTWERVRDEAGLEAKLYLPISHYPDEEFDAAVGALAALAGRDRRNIEHNAGRFLAPALLSTFSATIGYDGAPRERIAAMGRIAGDLEEDEEGDPPFTTSDDGEGVTVTCRENYDYCRLVRGLFEGSLQEFDASGTVAELGCVDDGDARCTFRVELD